ASRNGRQPGATAGSLPLWERAGDLATNGLHGSPPPCLPYSIGLPPLVPRAGGDASRISLPANDCSAPNRTVARASLPVRHPHLTALTEPLARPGRPAGLQYPRWLHRDSGTYLDLGAAARSAHRKAHLDARVQEHHLHYVHASWGPVRLDGQPPSHSALRLDR